MNNLIETEAKNCRERESNKGGTMEFSRKKFLAMILSLGLVCVPAAALTQTAQEKKLTEEVRKRLARLSELRAFDWISYKVEGTKVTLLGYASRPSLSTSAEKEVSRIKGVTEVDNKLEVLPVSPSDDDIRTEAYARIYTNPVLQRYAPGGGVTRSGFMDEAATIMHWGLDSSMSMQGPHQIHIIVKHGHLVLIGQLANQLEKQSAEAMVNNISGVFSVQNLIQIPQ